MLVIQQRIKLFKGWSWGTAIDAIARNKVAFKESDSSDTVDVTEKFVFKGQSQIENYTKGH